MLDLWKFYLIIIFYLFLYRFTFSIVLMRYLLTLHVVKNQLTFNDHKKHYYKKMTRILLASAMSVLHDIYCFRLFLSSQIYLFMISDCKGQDLPSVGNLHII
jgi:hypothetical protein